jgi:molybdenum cofactor synthesis domain-containing protein
LATVDPWINNAFCRYPPGSDSAHVKDNTAFIFCIGHELLAGMVLDRNAHFMAARLSGLGFRVRSIQVLDDVEEELVEAFRLALAQEPGFVFTTGGMGPGLDDITRQCVAKAAGVPLGSDPKAAEMLQRSYRRLLAKGVVEDAELSDERKRMTMVPKGAICFENPMGAAPAVCLEHGPTTVFMLPGTSEEMQRLFNDFALPRLEEIAAGRKRKTRVIDYPHRDESTLDRLLQEVMKRYPGITAKAQSSGNELNLKIKIVISAEHPDERTLDHQLARVEADLRARLGLER